MDSLNKVTVNLLLRLTVYWYKSLHETDNTINSGEQFIEPCISGFIFRTTKLVLNYIFAFAFFVIILLDHFMSYYSSV